MSFIVVIKFYSVIVLILQKYADYHSQLNTSPH